MCSPLPAARLLERRRVTLGASVRLKVDKDPGQQRRLQCLPPAVDVSKRLAAVVAGRRLRVGVYTKRIGLLFECFGALRLSQACLGKMIVFSIKMGRPL